jgi:hypothetical protein
MPDQTDFVVVEDSDSSKFPNYEMTHGLPKFIRRRTELDLAAKTNLLAVERAGLIDLTLPKKSQLKADSSSLEWDAYLLWRLSERYDQRPFPVGKLDKDRFVRLCQLGAISLVDPADLHNVQETTLVRISVPRRSLSQHFEFLKMQL